MEHNRFYYSDFCHSIHCSYYGMTEKTNMSMSFNSISLYLLQITQVLLLSNSSITKLVYVELLDKTYTKLHK